MGEERGAVNILTNTIKIKHIEAFQYLGLTIDKTGILEQEINNIIEKTLQVYQVTNIIFTSKKHI